MLLIFEAFFVGKIQKIRKIVTGCYNDYNRTNYHIITSKKAKFPLNKNLKPHKNDQKTTHKRMRWKLFKWVVGFFEYFSYLDHFILLISITTRTKKSEWETSHFRLKILYFRVVFCYPKNSKKFPSSLFFNRTRLREFFHSLSTQ